ncbi:MAG: hypothetical protein IJD14_05195 [Christensenellaceae bacterium]|nr:hypothetical protein [Christensenellaceae bacterium]
MKIISLDAVETLDSRGCPTLTAILKTDKGEFVSSVPSGASVGAHEAKEKRDGEKRVFKKGVLSACRSV